MLSVAVYELPTLNLLCYIVSDGEPDIKEALHTSKNTTTCTHGISQYSTDNPRQVLSVCSVQCINHEEVNISSRVLHMIYPLGINHSKINQFCMAWPGTTFRNLQWKHELLHI